MRLFILTFIILTFGWQKTSAQALVQKNSLVNVGMGFGSYFVSGTEYTLTFPPVYGGYERMISNHFSIGVFVSYTSSVYTYSMPDDYKLKVASSDTTVKWKTSYWSSGILGNYHLVNNNQFNAYIGLKLGYTISNNSGYGSTTLLNYLEGFSSGFLFGAQVGGRYFFSEHIAVNLELGYGVAIASGGLTFVF